MTQMVKIDHKDYELGETLGTGSYGRVRLAKHRETGEFYAFKILK